MPNEATSRESTTSATDFPRLTLNHGIARQNKVLSVSLASLVLSHIDRDPFNGSLARSAAIKWVTIGALSSRR